MSEEQVEEGLKHKFDVYRAGSTEEPIDGAFVMIPDRDPYAASALYFYAFLVQVDHPELSRGIVAYLSWLNEQKRDAARAQEEAKAKPRRSRKKAQA